MGKVNYTVEQIIAKLREVELYWHQGKTIAEAVRQIGVAEQTYYRWREFDEIFPFFRGQQQGLLHSLFPARYQRIKGIFHIFKTLLINIGKR